MVCAETLWSDKTVLLLCVLALLQVGLVYKQHGLKTEHCGCVYVRVGLLKLCAVFVLVALAVFTSTLSVQIKLKRFQQVK